VAYQTLSDPALRKYYDEKLDENRIEAPQIVVRPTSIAFGKVGQGEKQSRSFVIENRGGPASAIDISWEHKPDWAELIIEPDPESTFPIEVTILVDASAVSPGDK
jgi:hypothetical protein